MRILLTNDDGVHAQGIEVLEALARRFSDNVTVVAPAEEQSGTGRSLTLTRPVRLHRVAEHRWAVTGTPTDAVMMALAQVMPDRPDLVLSGVNRGGNLGEDVSYSGTVAGAMEGALAGIPSIALSQHLARWESGNRVSFAAAEAWGERMLRPLIDRLPTWAPRTLVNINFPSCAAEAVAGVRVVRQGLRDYGRVRFDKRTDPRGSDYFWLGLGAIEQTPQHDTDLEAVEAGFVTITPLHLDLTHDPSLAALADAYR